MTLNPVGTERERERERENVFCGRVPVWRNNITTKGAEDSALTGSFYDENGCIGKLDWGGERERDFMSFFSCECWCFGAKGRQSPAVHGCNNRRVGAPPSERPSLLRRPTERRRRRQQQQHGSGNWVTIESTSSAACINTLSLWLQPFFPFARYRKINVCADKDTDGEGEREKWIGTKNISVHVSSNALYGISIHSHTLSLSTSRTHARTHTHTRCCKAHSCL